MKRVITGLFIIIILFIVWYGGITDYFSLAAIKEKSDFFAQQVKLHYAWTSTLYILIYVGAIFIGLPVVMPLTMLGGYLFKLWYGILYSLIGATVGSLAYFLVIQYTVSKQQAKKYFTRLIQFQESMHAYGSFYLLFLHFITIVPYIVINSLAALSQVPTMAFIWTTVVGALPCLFLYSLAGTQLNIMTTTGNVMQPQFFVIFLVLAFLALIPIFINKWRLRYP